MFSCLCGDSAYPRIALGTTKWPSPVIESPAWPQATRAETTHGSPRSQAENRFHQLQNNYWKGLIELGSRPYQIETVESALDLVRLILDELELTTEGEELELQLQREVVDEGKSVPKTKAGKILETGGRKSRYGASMTKEEREAEKIIQEQLEEMDRQLAELATNKKPFSHIRRTFRRLATRLFGSVCWLFSC